MARGRDAGSTAYCSPIPALSRRAFLAGTAGGAVLALSGCAAGAEQLFSGGGSGTTVTVAIVSNPQMQDAITLSYLFEREHPDVHLNFVSLPENEARAKITADVSTQGGEFDVVMISNYETPMWSANGWLVNLQPYIDATPGYDAEDFLPQLRATLSHKGDLYSVPFYGESSFLMYRKDLMAKAGIRVPARPTWDQVGKIAAELNNAKTGQVGICLRGDPGWGENLAPIDTVINSFGGRWFNPAWQAQMTSPEVTHAVSTYVSILRNYGEPGAPEALVVRMRHPVQPGRRGHVVRRHLRREHDRGPAEQQGGLPEQRLCLGAEPGRPPVRLALHLVPGHPVHLPPQAGGVGLHRLDDVEVLHQDGGQHAGLVS